MSRHLRSPPRSDFRVAPPQRSVKASRRGNAPVPEIRRLRNLTRYRAQLMGDRTRDAVRLEKLLEDASITLSVVASSVTTPSAREMPSCGRQH
jgi:hypothetical protein